MPDLDNQEMIAAVICAGAVIALLSLAAFVVVVIIAGIGLLGVF